MVGLDSKRSGDILALQMFLGSPRTFPASCSVMGCSPFLFMTWQIPPSCG